VFVNEYIKNQVLNRKNKNSTSGAALQENSVAKLEYSDDESMNLDWQRLMRRVEDPKYARRSIEWGVMESRAGVTPFIERSVLQKKKPKKNPIKISYGTGQVEGNIAEDRICFNENQSLCLDMI